MSVNISDVRELTRYLIEDNSTTQIPGDLHTYTTSSVFSLSEANIVTVDSVLHNDVALASSEYDYSSSTNKVSISASLTTGDTIEIQFTFFENYSNSSIEKYVQAAAIHLSVNNLTTLEIDSSGNIYPEPTDELVNLLSVITSVLIDSPIKNLRLPDMSINFPDDLNPSEKIRQLISIFKKNSHGIFTVATTE